MVSACRVIYFYTQDSELYRVSIPDAGKIKELMKSGELEDCYLIEDGYEVFAKDGELVTKQLEWIPKYYVS